MFASPLTDVIPEMTTSTTLLTEHDGETQKVPDAQGNCGNNQKVSADSTQCINCPIYEVQSADKLSCEKAVCDADKIINWDGSCYKCGAYLVPDAEQYFCDYNTACTALEVIDFDGSCKTCPEFQKATSKYACASPTC